MGMIKKNRHKTAKDNCFILDGKSSHDWGLVVSGDSVFDAAERDREMISVPGRNGDLIIDNGRWRNVNVKYNDCYSKRNFPEVFNSFRNFVASRQGYVKLEDSFNPDEYRLANIQETKVNLLGVKYGAGAFDVTFNCKPQRFLKSGAEPIQFFPWIDNSGNLMTRYIPFNEADVLFQVHCDASETLNAIRIAYDSTGSVVYTDESNPVPVVNGQFLSLTYNSGYYYWRLKITGYSDASQVSVHIRTTSKFGDAPIEINALAVQKVTLYNPTGFRALPMIEVYARQFPTLQIRNYIKGELHDYARITQQSTFGPDATGRLFLDCDLQYLYNANGDNITKTIWIDNEDSPLFSGITFPSMGEDEIELTMYGTIYSGGGYADYNLGMGLVLLYANWWRV